MDDGLPKRHVGGERGNAHERARLRAGSLAGAATLAAQRLQDGRARSHEKQAIP
jgi:hypothetical protein